MHTFGNSTHTHTHRLVRLLMKLLYYFLFQTKLKSLFLCHTNSTSDYNELVMLPVVKVFSSHKAE